jgi:hypothetical protein
MAVTDPKTIDLIGIDKTTGDLVLTIADHLAWTDSVMHQQVLQEKLNTYMAYLESGEVQEHHPEWADRKRRISVVLKYGPDEDGRRFLNAVERIIANAGYGFSVEVFAASPEPQ